MQKEKAPWEARTDERGLEQSEKMKMTTSRETLLRKIREKFGTIVPVRNGFGVGSPNFGA
jgi:hypothetical protein